MAKSSFLACLALLAMSVLPTRATAAAGEYHWARGILRASSASAITLQLKDGSLTLRVDQATEVISPTPIDASTGRGLIPNLAPSCRSISLSHEGSVSPSSSSQKVRNCRSLP